MTNHQARLRIPKSRLRRDAERVVQITQRHAGTDPSLDARSALVVPLAERYVASDDNLATLNEQASLRRLMRDEGAQGLQDAVLKWLPSLRGDVPSFDTTGLADSDVAEDGVASSQRLRKRVEGLVLGGAELPYAAELDSSLVEQEERAQSLARSADAATAAAEQARQERHAAAVELDRELVVFRATLRRALGSTHRDYRRLRARTATERELEELDLDADEQPVEGEAHAEPDTDGEVGAA